MHTSEALAPRWRGQRGRLEVWYATMSDPGSGAGLWVHLELVAPHSADPYIHGWAAVFRTSKRPLLERFGPEPARMQLAGQVPATSKTSFLASSLHGEAGGVRWDLRLSELGEASDPLFTFPSWAWEREVLPGAQILPVPSARFEGVIAADGEEVRLSPEARGNLAHIYGHGNAERWGWLHAELGDGDLLEVVSAVSRLAGLRNLRPLTFLQLRIRGRDWPRGPMLAAPLLHTDLGLPQWSVRGTIGRYRLRAEIAIPPERAVALQYVDPDGDTATCTNSEMADAEIVLEHKTARWNVESRWTLQARAHAEIGTRP